jgi:hypothetical protein
VLGSATRRTRPVSGNGPERVRGRPRASSRLVPGAPSDRSAAYWTGVATRSKRAYHAVSRTLRHASSVGASAPRRRPRSITDPVRWRHRTRSESCTIAAAIALETNGRRASASVTRHGCRRGKAFEGCCAGGVVPPAPMLRPRKGHGHEPAKTKPSEPQVRHRDATGPSPARGGSRRGGAKPRGRNGTPRMAPWPERVGRRQRRTIRGVDASRFGRRRGPRRQSQGRRRSIQDGSIWDREPTHHRARRR